MSWVLDLFYCCCEVTVVQVMISYICIVISSTKAVVELYTLNLAESGQEMEVAGSLEVDSR